MTNEILDKSLATFLISPRYKVIRHFLLIMTVIPVIVENMISLPEGFPSLSHMIWGIIGYVIILIAAIYTNIYIGVRKFLLKNKVTAYFAFLIFTVILSLFSLFILQLILHTPILDSERFSRAEFIVNIFSSLIVLSFFIAGPTTLLLFKYWLISEQRINELKSTTLQSELQYLKSQINPHFLFNMLNSVNVLIKEKKGGAAELMNKLEDLLRYQINDSSRELTTLKSDIRFLNDFLNLEKIRRDCFTYSITIHGDTDNVCLPSLLLIPFVENAVKHSQDSEHNSSIEIIISVKENRLSFHCKNTIPPHDNRSQGVGGLGLKNIQRRLDLLFPNRHILRIEKSDLKYIVDLNIELI